MTTSRNRVQGKRRQEKLETPNPLQSDAICPIDSPLPTATRRLQPPNPFGKGGGAGPPEEAEKVEGEAAGLLSGEARRVVAAHPEVSQEL